MGYDEKIAELQKKLDEAKLAREARDEKELDELIAKSLHPALDDTLVLVRVQDAPPHLPGHIVGTRPSGPQNDRFKQLMWKDSSQRGVVEAKSRAGEQLAAQCLVYPTKERYAELCAAFVMVPEKFAKALIEGAEAGAEATGKG